MFQVVKGYGHGLVVFGGFAVFNDALAFALEAFDRSNRASLRILGCPTGKPFHV